MLWCVLVAMVGIVMLSAQEQFKREYDAACAHQLSREYSL